MDLKLFYQKMRKVESEIPEREVVVVSMATDDGGKAGRMNEVNRETAARLIVEGRARLATNEEAVRHHESLKAARKARLERLRSLDQ